MRLFPVQVGSVHPQGRCESGQALVEAVVVLGVAGILCTAIVAGSRLQSDWHQDLVNAHSVALAVALGHEKQKKDGLMGLLESHLDSLLAQRILPGVRREQVSADGLVQISRYGLRNDRRYPESPHLTELMGGGMQWIKVRTLSGFANHAWQVTGSGSLSQTRDTAGRISRARGVWQSVARPSITLVNRLAPAVERTDRPWPRAPATTDWLKRWRDVSGPGTARSSLFDQVMQWKFW